MTSPHKSALLWGACFVLALCVHGAGAAALLAHWTESPDAIANAPVIAIELAPPVAPAIKPTDAPQGPQQSDAQPQPEPAPVKPVEKVELPPDPQAEPVGAITPPPQPIERPKEKKPRHPSLASAPTNAERRADRAAAPAQGAAAPDSNAVPNWKSLLVATLERSKRYPAEAQARGDHGVAELAFSVDRSGHVHHARIVSSSGSSLLDRETLAMLGRAAPLPPPPPEIAGHEIPIVVPIRYNMR